jgi:hypothetical protein
MILGFILLMIVIAAIALMDLVLTVDKRVKQYRYKIDALIKRVEGNERVINYLIDEIQIDNTTEFDTLFDKH